MFYNTYRTTKSAQREVEKYKLTGVGQSIIYPRERLVNLQKKQKIKDLLITKFMQKYGIKHPEQFLEDEITKFLQGEKLTDNDLKRLDTKVKNLIQENAKKAHLKNTLSQSMLPSDLNRLNTQNEVNRNLGKSLNQETLNQNFAKSGLRGNSVKSQILNTEPFTQKNRGYTPVSSNFGKNPTFAIKYQNLQEELAALQAELGIEEKKKNERYQRLDFSNEGDEWAAMAKYNRKMYEKQIEDERIRDQELQRRNREDLDLQIKQRLKKEYEDDLKEKEYDKLMEEHQKKLDEIEKERQEKIKNQLLREKKVREEQMKENDIRRKIELLKDKKYENALVKSIQESIENDKKNAQEKMRKENEALNKAIKENEEQKQRKKEKEKLEQEEDMKMAEERIKMDMKEEIARKNYYDKIKKYGNKYNPVDGQKVAEKMKKDDEEEDKKVQFYYEEKNRLTMQKEKEKELKKLKEKEELKKYLDRQIEEKKREEEFLKSLDDEQARIWEIDAKKYREDEKIIEQKIRAMNQRHLDQLKAQFKNKKRNDKNRMTDTEYAMNRDTLLKAKATLNSK